MTVSPADGASFDDEGYATFTITAPNAKDLIQLDFELRPPQPVGSLVPPKTSRTSVVLKVRDNSNVTFGEVLDGEAVFVADYYSNGRKSEGKYPDGKKVSEIDERDRKFIYVQELLNQVVSRKRNLTEPYTLTDEDGKYGSGGTKAVKAFRDNFKIGNSAAAFEKGADGEITYKTEDNTSAIIRKLSKDYGVRAQGDAQVAAWMHKVVDKQSLAGKDLKLHGVAETPDYIIGSDAGLYELYKNVVERFVNGMLEEAERYAGLRGTSGIDAPTDNWYSRSNKSYLSDEKTPNMAYGPKGCKGNETIPSVCAGEHGPGMAYSFGNKQTISDFNRTVALWQAPPGAKVYNSLSLPVVSSYRGNLNGEGKIDSAITAANDHTRWAGLYQGNEHDDKGAKPQFSPEYWSGIDCVGLVLRSIKGGYDSVTGNTIGVKLGEVYSYLGSNSSKTDKSEKYRLHTQGALEWLTSGQLNKTTLMDGNVYYQIANDEDSREFVKKGDVGIKTSHDYLLYTNWGDGRLPSDYPENDYDIIHSFGFDCTPRSGIAESKWADCSENNKWFRKVGVTTGRRKGLGNANKFGRLKLWD